MIRLSDHFTYRRLLRFAMPSIGTMIVTSVYSIVDGFFVSNYAGKTPFAALNLIFPIIMIISAVGFMLSTGGSAIVAKTLGEGNREKANRYFSLFTYVALVLGILFSILGNIFLTPIARALGAEGELLHYAIVYGRVLLIALPFFVLQLLFQSFFVTAEKPHLGLAVTLIAGFVNMVLDAVLVMGLPEEHRLLGAALATAISQGVGGGVPLVYFLRRNSSLLRLSRTRFDGRALLKACTNGSSELMSQISMNLVGMLYNIQLMRYAGEDGIAAYGVMMYVSMIFSAAFIGYSIGTAPIVSFHDGAGHKEELRGVFRKSIVIILVFSVSMFLLSELCATPLARIFVGYDSDLLALTVSGFRIFSFSFLLMGIPVYGSSFFTALNDGLTSALISFFRTLVFQLGAVLLLPAIFEIDGVWYSIVVAEFMALLLTLFFLIRKRRRFGF